jgi:uncharacterized membrane protein YgcG
MGMKGRITAAAGLLAAGLAALAATATVASADDFGAHQAGQHVYDRASVLTPAHLTDLEAKAAAVERAGAPTVVLVRSKAADDATARQDARDLMDAWGVESAAGAHDGLVVLVDLRPGDALHGSAALIAGSRWASRLGDARLQSIYDVEMRPHLARGDIAGALAGALTAAASDLGDRGDGPRAPDSVGTARLPGAADFLLPALMGLVVAGAMVAGALAYVVSRRYGRRSAGWGSVPSGRRSRGWVDPSAGSASSASWTGWSAGVDASSGDSSGGTDYSGGSSGGSYSGGSDPSSGSSSGGGSF